MQHKIRLVVSILFCAGSIPFVTSIAQAQSGIAGVTWTGAPGITETVSQLMAREKNTHFVPPTAPRTTKPPLDYSTIQPKENPSAPLVSQWPPLTGQRAPTAPRNPQPVGTSFLGISLQPPNFPESGYIPPDSMGDVGPTQIFMAANGRYKVFDKAGNVGALNVSDKTFWASQTANGISDPQVRYDRLSGRWFAIAIDIPPSNKNNKVLLAVSSGPSITGTASFNFFSFQISGPTPSDSNNFCDYPSLGVDANAVYTGCNMFSAAGSFQHSSAYVIRKSSVTGGGPIVVTGFYDITGGATAGPISPRGVDNDDPQATEGYFIGPDVAFLSRLQIRRVSTPGGTPTLSGNLTLIVPATTNMSTQQALGSTTNLDASDTRLFQAALHKNKITGVNSLWTAHVVEVDTSCVATSGASSRIGARWYEITNLTSTPSLSQSGTLCTSGSSSALNSLRGFIYPTVAETGQGHMILGSSYASSTEWAGVAVAGRLRTDAAGTIQAPTIAQAGLGSYTLLASGRNRWGDYSFTDVDPNDDMTVWTFQEYALDATGTGYSGNWGVRAVQVMALLPATPSSIAPVAQGQSSVNATLTGTSSGGTEFFDPGPDTGGPGYANHITATLTGATGVVVKGVTFTDPTHITLNLDTTSASLGCPTVAITVTNPDGQKSNGNMRLSIAPAGNVGPVWIGGGGNSNWSNASNWVPAAVPSATDLVRFDPGCSSASATVDTNATVGGLTVLSGYAGTIAEGGSNLTINGNYNQQGGTVAGGAGTLSVSGTFTLGGGTFTAPAALVLGGNFSNAATFNHNNGLVTLNGASAQTIGGASSTTFNNLTLNNAAGISLNTNTTVNGTLAFTSGNLTAGTGANQLVLGSSSTVTSTAATGGDVIGDVVRNSFAAGTTYGFNNPYTSITLGPTSTLPSSIVINLNKTKPPEFTTAVSRTYGITLTGSSSYTATLRLRYASSETSGMTEANLKLWRYDGTQSRFVLQGGTQNIGDGTNRYVSLPGVTQFSRWAISDNGAPTAITLSDLSAHSPGSVPTPILAGLGILGILALGGVGFIVFRR